MGTHRASPPATALPTIGIAIMATTILLTSSACNSAPPTTPDLTCGFISGGPGCGAFSATAVYAFVRNSRSGKWISGARVEIVGGANAGLSCVTGEGHGYFVRKDPGCLLGQLRPTGQNRRVRISKPGFIPVTRSVGDDGLGHAELLGVAWDFTLRRSHE